MAKYAQVFMKAATARWGQEFPWLQPARSALLLHRAKSRTFTCSLCPVAGRYYLFYVDFTPKRAGEFTMDVLIAAGPEEIDPSIRWPDDIPSLPCGSYRIGFFLPERRDMWWTLKDNEGELATLRMSPLPPRQGLWRPTSFDQPLDVLVAEALDDLTCKLRQFVFPTLGIKADSARRHGDGRGSHRMP